MATIVGKNPANDPDKKPVKNRSHFKPNRSFYNTLPFGLNSPIFASEVVESDKMSIRVNTDIDTLNMKAPMLTPVKMSKDYFYAPLRSILPHNAELVETNPLTGQDIDAGKVLPILTASKLNSFRADLLNKINNSLASAPYLADASQSSLELLRCLIISVSYGDLFFSASSLVNQLGANLHGLVSWSDTVNEDNLRTNKAKSWDQFVELLCDTILQHVKYFTCTELYYSSGPSLYSLSDPETRSFIVDCSLGSDEGYSGRSNTISFRRFLEELRQGRCVGYVKEVVLKDPSDTSTYSVYYPNSTTTINLQPGNLHAQKNYNVSRAVAYQLACASFYTDDAVDYVYSCKLWHQNQLSCARYALGVQSSPGVSGMVYMLNGIQQEYDSVSNNILDNIIMNLMGRTWSAALSSSDVEAPVYYNSGSYRGAAVFALGYVNNLFGLTRSLKFRDYFCGSKTRPMAVGNVDVQVQSGSFSVVDVTKNIQMQRFLNQVNRVGRKFNEYVQGIFGVTPMHDPSEVIFLGHTSEYIGSEETNNTGSDMMSESQTTRSKMRRSSSQFAFEGSFSDSGIVVGIINFDVARPYTISADRAFFHYDRFDMFNPYLQHIGDQEVFGAEIDPNQSDSFGYQLRYAEYKQSVDIARGGFLEFLPGFAFLNDSMTMRNLHSGGSIVISPDFIRSRPTELDRFYNVMSNYSQAGYFHFFCRHDVQVSADRPMEAAPSIL